MRLISLGAGVQSSVLALMAERGVIPKVDGAIFSDTQSEPASVYSWLDRLEEMVSFPIYRVTAGSLIKDETRIRVSGKSGKKYLKGSIPAFVLNPDGGKGLLGRKCTTDYKVIPIQREVKRLAGVKRSAGKVLASVLIGISWDEVRRMKHSRVPYIVNEWPLIDMRMTRTGCLDWMKKNGYPVPPRSSCLMCPFHSDEEWSRLKSEEPLEFARAVEFERQMHIAQKEQDTLRGVPYLHASCQPIDTVDFSAGKAGMQQLDMFENDCEGLCGV